MSTIAPPPALDAAVATSGGDDVVGTERKPSIWWLWLVTGTAWIVASLVVLQFDRASVATVGFIAGVLFAGAAARQFVMAGLADSHRWLWTLFGVVFSVAALLCFIRPVSTFVGLADMLGFLFLWVGVWWTIAAFLEKPANPMWWLGLASGLLMIVVAFWTSGQFFIEKAYALLVFAGIWALLQGVGDIARAFQVRAVERTA